MPRTKTKGNRKQKHLRETKRKVFSKRIGRGIFDSKFAILLGDNAKAKAEYQNRLFRAYALNKQLLKEQREAIIHFEKQGVDGPHTRTRGKTTKAKLTTTKEPMREGLEQLYKDRMYTQNALNWNEYGFRKLKDGKPEDYKKLLTQPNWDMERMAPLAWK